MEIRLIKDIKMKKKKSKANVVDFLTLVLNILETDGNINTSNDNKDKSVENDNLSSLRNNIKQSPFREGSGQSVMDSGGSGDPSSSTCVRRSSSITWSCRPVTTTGLPRER